MSLRIIAGGLDDPRVLALLRHHIEAAKLPNAPQSNHAFSADELKHPAVTFWSAWDDDALMGTAALHRLDDIHAEVKSMHVVTEARGHGIGAALMAHILDQARHMGLKRLSLETGGWDYFKPALALYHKFGFVPCPPFGDYSPDPNSVFLTREV